MNSRSDNSNERNAPFRRPDLVRDTAEQDLIYQELFNSSPLGLWEEDWSQMKQRIDQLQAEGITDWENFFSEQKDLLLDFYNMVPLTEINLAALKIYGASSIEEAEALSNTELQPEAEVSNFLNTLLAFMGKVWSFEFESREINSLGEEIVTRRIVTIPHGYRDSWSRVLYIIEDITARKSMEISLKESEARYHEIFDEAPSALFVENWAGVKTTLDDLGIKDQQGFRDYYQSRPKEVMALYDIAESLQTSNATLQLYGVKTSCEYHTRAYAKDAIPEELSVFQDIIIGLLERRWRQEHESLDTRFDGTRFLVRSHMVVPFGHRGNWSRVIFSLEDVTERKMADKALQEAVHQTALANRSMTEFLANMSHELRTPLNAIIGFSHIINTEMLGPVGEAKYLEYAKDINDSSVHLLGIISDILDLSKLEAGKVDLVEEDVDLKAAITSCLTLVDERAKEAKVALVQDLEVGLPFLRGDLQKLKQILINLLTNAIKFTPGPGQVTLKAWHEPKDGFFLQVIDTGIGIPAKDIPRALAPFEQIANPAVGLTQKGTGLGLSVTKTLVELHGGELKIDSTVGEGTTVSLKFPPSRVVLTIKKKSNF